MPICLRPPSRCHRPGRRRPGRRRPSHRRPGRLLPGRLRRPGRLVVIHQAVAHLDLLDLSGHGVLGLLLLLLLLRVAVLQVVNNFTDGR